MTSAATGPLRRVPRIAGGGMGLVVVLSALALVPALASTVAAVPSVSVRTGAIALAVGLDVLALSIGIGVLGIPWGSRLRIGFSFAAAEIFMQIAGAVIGAGAGRVVGDIAAYAGFTILAAIGVWMFYESFGNEDVAQKATSGWGLLAASASISLDSLGVGFTLPALRVPLLPLLGTVAITTLVFTLVGLRFGEKLGELYQRGAQRAAALVLVGLAVLFTIERLH